MIEHDRHGCAWLSVLVFSSSQDNLDACVQPVAVVVLGFQF